MAHPGIARSAASNGSGNRPLAWPSAPRRAASRAAGRRPGSDPGGRSSSRPGRVAAREGRRRRGDHLPGGRVDDLDRRAQLSRRRARTPSTWTRSVSDDVNSRSSVGGNGGRGADADPVVGATGTRGPVGIADAEPAERDRRGVEVGHVDVEVDAARPWPACRSSPRRGTRSGPGGTSSACVDLVGHRVRRLTVGVGERRQRPGAPRGRRPIARAPSSRRRSAPRISACRAACRHGPAARAAAPTPRARAPRASRFAAPGDGDRRQPQRQIGLSAGCRPTARQRVGCSSVAGGGPPGM